jgi:glycosyltransferase involved in cell wall biosynthesis
MRIWILNHYASPPDRAAGTRHYDFGRVLAEQGHEVTIFASSYNHLSRQEERLSPGERMRVEWFDGVRFVWVRTPPYAGNNYRRVANMLSYAAHTVWVQHRFSRPDVIVGSSVHMAAVAAAYVIGRVRSIPFVFEVRDVWPQTLIDMGALRRNSLAARILGWAELFFYRRARMVISLLPKAPDYIAGRGISKEKIAYIPNGTTGAAASAETLTGDAAELVARITQLRRNGCVIAGYVGSHGRANALGTLVHAARELRDRGEDGIVFVFVGDGPEKETCQRLARYHDLHNVIFWRPVPKRSVPAVLEALDVTLISLLDVAVLQYGLSCNKLFDYLASGRPVVSACAVEETPVSVSGGGICVPPEKPEAIADALIALSSLGEAGRRAIGDRGKHWVYENHHVNVLAERFLQTLEQAAQC